MLRELTDTSEVQEAIAQGKKLFVTLPPGLTKEEAEAATEYAEEQGWTVIARPDNHFIQNGVAQP